MIDVEQPEWIMTAPTPTTFENGVALRNTAIAAMAGSHNYFEGNASYGTGRVRFNGANDVEYQVNYQVRENKLAFIRISRSDGTAGVLQYDAKM